jgi:hypothetical protein
VGSSLHLWDLHHVQISALVNEAIVSVSTLLAFCPSNKPHDLDSLALPEGIDCGNPRGSSRWSIFLCKTWVMYQIYTTYDDP